MIRLAAPFVDRDDVDAVAEVLLSGNLVQGARVAAFEAAVAGLAGTEHAVAVTNCTAALELSLRAMDVGPGDSVAVAAYSWVSTANVIELVGARPLFVDVDITTHNMSADALESVLDSSGPVAAVIPVDTFGNLAGLDRIAEISGERGIPLLEDAACSLGAHLADRRAGSFGVAACFSFHPRKAVTTGEGGVVATDSAEVAHRVRTLRNHGLDPNAAGPDFIEAASNTRMTEFQAALGITQLNKLYRILEVRRLVAARYEELFAGTAVVTPRPDEAHVLQSYVVLLPPGAEPARSLVPRLRERGVEASVGTWHLPLTTYYSAKYGFTEGMFPGTDEVFARALSLPIHHLLEQDDQQKVAGELLDLLP